MSIDTARATELHQLLDAPLTRTQLARFVHREASNLGALATGARTPTEAAHHHRGRELCREMWGRLA